MNNALFTSKTGLWETPQEFFDKLNREFDFTLDAWFHDYIYRRAEIRFVRGRLKFGGSRNSAPFPSMVCVFRGKTR